MSKRLIDSSTRPAVLSSMLLLLLIACAWAIWLQYQQFERIGTMEAAIQELQYKQFDRMTTLEATTQQQTEILNAALGNALPVKMSPKWEGRLKELEAKVAEPDLWPTDASRAQEFVDELSQLISELSPLSESNYFPRLSLVRWAAVAFDILHHTPAPDESLGNLVEQIRAVADAKPDGVASELDQRLRVTADNWAAKAEAQLVEETIQEARKYLTSNDAARQETISNDASIDEVYEILGIYENDSQRDDEIRELRTKLQRQIVIREAQSQAAALNDQWAEAKKLATSKPDVYRTAASMLLGEATSARAVLVLQGIHQPVYDSLEGEIRDAVEGMQDEARRRYQEWALGQVIRFQKKHMAIAERASRDARYLSFDNGGWTDDRFREVQRAMESYLLPINRALLDLPVLMRYQREFDEGWSRLDGREEQTNVARASSLREKRNLHSVQ